MKKFLIAAFTFGLVAAPVGSAMAKTEVLFLMSADGQALGRVNNYQDDFLSICNQHGNHGSSYSPVSIFSQFSAYGMDYSDLSAYNPGARRPPVLVRGKTPVAFVTKNTQMPNPIDPDDLRRTICR